MHHTSRGLNLVAEARIERASVGYEPTLGPIQILRKIIWRGGRVTIPLRPGRQPSDIQPAPTAQFLAPELRLELRFSVLETDVLAAERPRCIRLSKTYKSKSPGNLSAPGLYLFLLISEKLR